MSVLHRLGAVMALGALFNDPIAPIRRARQEQDDFDALSPAAKLIAIRERLRTPRAPKAKPAAVAKRRKANKRARQQRKAR